MITESKSCMTHRILELSAFTHRYYFTKHFWSFNKTKTNKNLPEYFYYLRLENLLNRYHSVKQHKLLETPKISFSQIKLLKIT